MKPTILLVLTIPFLLASNASAETRINRSLSVGGGLGGAGMCAFSASGTRETPCQYLTSAELGLRLRSGLPVRLLAGVRLAAYINDFHDRYYVTSGWEPFVGAAVEVWPRRFSLAGEVFAAVGPGFGSTDEDLWVQERKVASHDGIDNRYFMADVGYQLIKTWSGHFFLQAKVAATFVRFNPEVSQRLGAQMALPRTDILVGVHF